MANHHPCPYPRRGTKTSKVASFLATNDSHGRVTVPSLLERYPELSRSDLFYILPRLRKDFHYYAKLDGDLIVCGSWPTYTIEPSYDDNGYPTPTEKIHKDPRLSITRTKTKFRVPAKGTMLYEIAVYLLRHRSAGTHWCNATYLYERFGSLKVHKRIKVLNEKCGFNIRKPIRGLKDNMWIVDKHRNLKLNPSTSEPEFVELDEEQYQKIIRI